MRIFTQEMERFLIDNYYGSTRKEITKSLNEKFNKNLSEKTVTTKIKHLKLKNGTGGRFLKGNIPYNTYKKYSEKFMNGYVYIKTGDVNEWMPKQRYLYEQAYGKLDDDEVVVFVDGNINNFDLNNLIKMKRAANGYRMNENLFSDNADINRCCINYAKLKVAIKEKERRKK